VETQEKALEIKRVSKPITMLVDTWLLKVNLNSTAVTISSRGE
jgi:hypothetical protein